jgi:hypothetical protein
LVGGVLRPTEDALGVPLDVADRRVDLGERETQLGHQPRLTGQEASSARAWDLAFDRRWRHNAVA